MTHPLYEPAPSPEPPAADRPSRPPLRRRRDDRVLGGVCSGVAGYLGVDPVLVRVVLVVLALFGGGGILVYLAAWLLIPEAGREQSAAQQLIGGNNSQTALFVVIAAAIGLAIALSVSGLWFGMGPDLGAPGVLLMIAAVVLVVWLVRRNDPPSTARQAAAPTIAEPALSPPPAHATAVLPATGPPLAPLPPPLPKPPRSVLGLLTVSAAALVAGGLLVVELAFPDSTIDAVTIFGAALAVVGIGLVLGAFVGRSRWLIVLGVVLTLATAVSAAAQSVDLAGGVGERTWHPVTAAEALDEFQLGIGDATLDLRDLEVPAGGLFTPITASVSMGQLTVYVPDDVDVEITANVGLGQINVPGQPAVDGTRNDLTTVIDVPDESDAILLDLSVGIGEVSVTQRPTRGLARIQPPGALQ